MSKHPFYKLSPGGNVTVLVMQAHGFDPARRAAAANDLLTSQHNDAEQVGFVSETEGVVRLDMMGGEFCGNAARSLASVLAREGRLAPCGDGQLGGRISVSGGPGLLEVRVSQDAQQAAVQMPVMASRSCVRSLEPGLHAVHLEGIRHLLLDRSVHSLPDDLLAASALLRQQHGLEAEPAVGCIWYRLADPLDIVPVVWVRETNSVFRETACGSGTMALAQLVSVLRGRDVDICVAQPSGAQIRARVEYSPDTGGFANAWIDGPVALMETGELFLT